MAGVAVGMGSLLESLTVAGVVLAGGLIGLALQRLLPAEHITNQKTHEVILLGTGMLSVLASLVLGLQITTAKSSYDATDTAVRNYAAELILLDEILRDYGPKAAIARDCLRAFATRMKDDIWHDPGGTATPIYCPGAASPAQGTKSASD